MTFLISCGETKKGNEKELTSENLEKLEIQKELKSVDSIIVVIDRTMKDIQDSHESLEKALNEIQ